MKRQIGKAMDENRKDEAARLEAQPAAGNASDERKQC